MTNKEIAQRLRELDESGNWGGVQALADQLDPPRPEPGTLVLALRNGAWVYGIVNIDGMGVRFYDGWFLRWGEIKYKPARIAGPMQVIFDVPTVGEWPAWAESIEWRFIGGPATVRNRPIITRAEAERMEAGDGE